MYSASVFISSALSRVKIVNFFHVASFLQEEHGKLLLLLRRNTYSLVQIIKKVVLTLTYQWLIVMTAVIHGL